MCPTWCLVVLMLCVTNVALSDPFESEDVTLLRVDGRGRGRFWKRSEEQPSFRLSAFGKDFTLNLVRDASFLSPSLTIQRVKAQDLSLLRSGPGAQGESDVHMMINRTDEPEGHLRDCFYSGTVDQNQDSVVSVSLCHGVIGSFITEGNEYLIEPKRRDSGRPEGSTEQLHVITRRSGESLDGAPLLFDQLSEEGRLPLDEESFTQREEDAHSEPRRKRFVSAPRYIETLVVADASMTRFYGDEIKHYVLTLVSMASQLYRHPSLRNAVSLVVVKMLVVEEEGAGPQLHSNAGVALRNFCAWQQMFNPAGQRHPGHYDTAVLFTREDICGHQTCDTLGVADVGTMCDPKRSCSVVEDNGLQAAFTMAHELGHVLSMPHDDPRACGRLSEVTGSGVTGSGFTGSHHLMAPLFVQLNRTAPWSACSARYVTEFFDNGHGDCLLDPPESLLPLPSELPGLVYSLDRQCQQVFGAGFLHCPNGSTGAPCGQLWCREGGLPHCLTRNGSLAWADGTACGANHTCLGGACVPSAEALLPPVAVDGDWGAWGPWQQCSRSCGGGVEFSHRDCSDPVPRNGGRYCEGQRVRYQSCNTEPCPENQGKSFREEQCEKYNSPGSLDLQRSGPGHLDLQRSVKQWIPKYAGVSPRDRCKLVCRARSSSEFKVFETKVVDGTPCGSDTTSVCVQGQCVKAGCDRAIGSAKRTDKCGVCGGNGLSCRKITGAYNKNTYGYTDIVTIPAGATNIDVKQRSHRGVKRDGNYLAVRRAAGGYVLNGNLSVSTAEQDVPVLGAVLRYSGSSTTLERIQSFRPLREPITVQLLGTGADAGPPKVKYSFFIPRDAAFARPKEKKGGAAALHRIQAFGTPDWALGEWSECSKSCGSGWSRRAVACRDSGGFPSGRCDGNLKPSDIRACGDLPCPLWQLGPWSACSRTCGAGERTRSAVCSDYTGKSVEAERCDADKRPPSASGECFLQDCP